MTVLGLSVAGMLIAGHKLSILGLGGDVLLLTLGFGFIPDLIDGHGEEPPKSGQSSKLEEYVRTLLGDLSEDFHVVHDVDSPHGTLRHIVFSRTAGVFIIEAKPRRDALQADSDSLEGEAHPAEPHVLDQCTCRAYWLRERITQIVGEKPWITPLLVIPNAFVPQGLKVDGVRIVNVASLISTLSESAGRRRKSNHIWDARTLIADSLLG